MLALNIDLASVMQAGRWKTTVMPKPQPLHELFLAVYLVSWLCGPQTTCILEFCGKIEMYIVLR